MTVRDKYLHSKTMKAALFLLVAVCAVLASGAVAVSPSQAALKSMAVNCPVVRMAGMGCPNTPKGEHWLEAVPLSLRSSRRLFNATGADLMSVVGLGFNPGTNAVLLPAVDVAAANAGGGVKVTARNVRLIRRSERVAGPDLSISPRARSCLRWGCCGKTVARVTLCGVCSTRGRVETA